MITLRLYNRGPHLTNFRGLVDVHDDGSVRWHDEPYRVEWQHHDFMTPNTVEQESHQ